MPNRVPLAMAALAAFLTIGGGCGGRLPPGSAGGGGSIAGSGLTSGTGGSGSAGVGGAPGVGGSGPPGAGCSGWCPSGCNPRATAFAPSRIWLITDEQYVNVVRDVLGVTLSGSDAEITGPAGDGGEYLNEADARVFTDAMAMSFQAAAEKVASQAITPATMTALIGSTAPTDEEVKAFIASKVARLWRRPVSTSEKTRLRDLYQQGLVDGAPRGLELLIESALQAPAFLFRTELGAEPTAKSEPFKLNVYEHAAALAFLFTNSAPDDALWQKATNGTLSDPSVLATEVDRLLSLPATQAQLVRYASYWLSIERTPTRDRDPLLFPAFDATLRRSLYESGRAFVRDIVLGGKLSDLFTSRRVYVNDALSAAYGIEGARGPELVPVESVLPERSSGILTQPATFVAVSHRGQLSDPVHRGLFVLENLLCGADLGPIAPEPADAIEIAAKMQGDERELAEHRSMMGCAGCHTVFDPFGLTMERYDAIGGYSSTRQVRRNYETMAFDWVTYPKPIDASAKIYDSVGADLRGAVDGVSGLAQRLASDQPMKRVSYCAAARLTRYALGYDTKRENSCGLQDIQERLYASGSLLQFYRDLASSPGFATRRPQQATQDGPSGPRPPNVDR